MQHMPVHLDKDSEDYSVNVIILMTALWKYNFIGNVDYGFHYSSDDILWNSRSSSKTVVAAVAAQQRQH